MIVLREHKMPSCPTCRSWKETEGEMELLVEETFGERFIGFRKHQRKIKHHLHFHILLKEE